MTGKDRRAGKGADNRESSRGGAHARNLERARRQLAAANARLNRANEELLAANDELAAANDDLALANKELLKESGQRRRAEEGLRREKAAVEKSVRVKSEQLTAAWRELEQSSRLCDIGSLAATVAHELRNPLAAISMAARNIARKAAGADIGSQLANISKKISESDQIIDNLLFYSRLRPPRYEKVPLFGLVEESIAACLYKSKKPVAVLRELDAIRRVSVDGDAAQLAELFGNIIGNACDAVPADGGEIRVSAEAGEEFVELRVQDNGPGIAPGIAGRVFDPFFTTKARGTGLGLTVCRQIVAQHHGELGLGQARSRGAVFFVRLRRKRLRAPSAG